VDPDAETGEDGEPGRRFTQNAHDFSFTGPPSTPIHTLD
jgi:hypothetical protein